MRMPEEKERVGRMDVSQLLGEGDICTSGRFCFR